MDRAHLAVRLRESVERYGDRVATRVRNGNSWETRTYAEFGADASAVAGHLLGRGVEAGDRVAIFSANRPEWSVADFACLTVRAVTVPLYATSTPEQVLHILRDSGSMYAFANGRSELERLASVWPELPELRGVFTFEDAGSDDPRVVSLARLLAEPQDQEATQAAVEERLAGTSGAELASIIYTSGTTGDPRGAMLTHRGFTWQLEALDEFFDLSPEDHSLCFLPLSHALERAWTFYILMHGCMNTYVANAAQVAEMLVLAEPTLVVSVPRLYEKVISTARAKVASSPAKKRIFEWALRVGGQCQRALRKGKQPARYWRAQLPLADKLVLSSVREAMGGPKTAMACGGAPLRQEIEEFFSACGMLVCQGYGLTEASPLVSFNAPGAFKFGTCGRIIAGGEVRIAAEGEILYRGSNVMQGYWNLPELTADTVDEQGWLHTGDVGYVDTDGFLVITDRIKDLIVTSGGKNIAPAPIESILLADPLFEQAVILGNNRPYLTLLVSPSLPNLEDLARQLQIKWEDRSDLLNHPQVIGELKRRVSEATSKLAQHEQIRDLRVMFEDFTMDNGLLTPTLKVKRKAVEERFGQLIDDMYAKVAERRGRREDGDVHAG